MSGALRELEPQLLADLGPGEWRIESRHVEPTRYRTELGAALRYTVQARHTHPARFETRRCYLKVYRNDHGAETYQLLRALAERTVADQKRFSVVSPIAYVGELRTLALAEAPGTPLQRILIANEDWETAVRAVARAVAAFNRDKIQPARQHSRMEQFDDVKRASSLVQWACPEIRAQAKTLTKAVLSGLKEVPPAPIHRDLKPDHIFLDGGRVVFIDLDSVALGDPVRDPAHLFAHFIARVGMDSLSFERAHAAAAAFADEYFAHVPKSWRARFPLHCAGALIEVAGGIFKRQESHWPEKVATCIEEAQHALDT
jgi:tRNA A-37 threonylcarbamoyl transferase component Bud32